jgi:hypothetical protein
VCHPPTHPPTHHSPTHAAQAFLLETDNKKLVRALQREVGDDVPLPKVLEEGGDWKGRREQIASLREQLKQLKEAQVRQGRWLSGVICDSYRCSMVHGVSRWGMAHL